MSEWGWEIMGDSEGTLALVLGNERRIGYGSRKATSRPSGPAGSGTSNVARYNHDKLYSRVLTYSELWTGFFASSILCIFFSGYPNADQDG